MSDLLKKVINPSCKYLVFTSAGDNSNLECWLKGRKNFDLWVSYFGNQDQRYIEQADYYIKRKGGKFPNLKFAYENWKDIIDAYDAIFVLDDDLIFSGTDISRLFEIMVKEDLLLLQPAFDKRGKISFKLNEVYPFSYLRYTNFVENTCPMFTKACLSNFIETFDPRLNGWGIDFWYCELVSKQNISKDKIAIVDLISCINPRDNKKINNKREIDLLQSRDDRIAVWEKIKKENNLSTQYEEIQYSQKNKFNSIEVWFKSLRVIALKYSYIIYKKLTGGRIYPVK